jgi:hypothetical protein
LQWTPAITALIIAPNAFGSRTSETHNCLHSRSVYSWSDVCAQITERNAAAPAAVVARAAATAAAKHQLFMLSVFPTRAQGSCSCTRADPFGLRRMPQQVYTATGSTVSLSDSSPVGDPEDAWEGLQQTRGIVSNYSEVHCTWWGYVRH